VSHIVQSTEFHVFRFGRKIRKGMVQQISSPVWVDSCKLFCLAMVAYVCEKIHSVLTQCYHLVVLK